MAFAFQYLFSDRRFVGLFAMLSLQNCSRDFYLDCNSFFYCFLILMILPIRSGGLFELFRKKFGSGVAMRFALRLERFETHLVLHEDDKRYADEDRECGGVYHHHHEEQPRVYIGI